MDMLNEKAYKTLLANLLPDELNKNFDLVNVSEGLISTKSDGSMGLHLYLDEKENPPEGRTDLQANGFYEESRITDFPIRDKSVELHIRRRRWKDATGKSYSNDYKLCEDGTRMSCELAAFLKEYIGRTANYRQIFGTSISHRRR